MFPVLVFSSSLFFFGIPQSSGPSVPWSSWSSGPLVPGHLVLWRVSTGWGLHSLLVEGRKCVLADLNG